MQVRLRIRALREAAGLTQEALGRQTGVGKATVCKWELHRQYPGVDRLPILAAALHCEINDLYERIPPGEAAS